MPVSRLTGAKSLLSWASSVFCTKEAVVSFVAGAPLQWADIIFPSISGNTDEHTFSLMPIDGVSRVKQRLADEPRKPQVYMTACTFHKLTQRGTRTHIRAHTHTRAHHFFLSSVFYNHLCSGVFFWQAAVTLASANSKHWAAFRLNFMAVNLRECIFFIDLNSTEGVFNKWLWPILINSLGWKNKKNPPAY